MKFTLAPVAKRLTELLGLKCRWPTPSVPTPAKVAALTGAGRSCLKIHALTPRGENDPEFAKELASLAEIFVNDAFGAAHRAHASTAGVAAYLPAVCGYLIQKEITIMGKALENPSAPL